MMKAAYSPVRQCWLVLFGDIPILIDTTENWETLDDLDWSLDRCNLKRNIITNEIESGITGTYCLTNCASLNIYSINDFEDKVLAGLNSETPEWCTLFEDGFGFYFYYPESGDTPYYLTDFLKC